MFLANENFPKPSITFLRSEGFQVKSIQEETPGISDEEVMKIAVEDNLIILTFDSDYGELVFRYANEIRPSVVYFREKSNTPNFAGEALVSLLKIHHRDFFNCFTVIERNGVRQRFY